jgi:hypothetical protein
MVCDYMMYMKIMIVVMRIRYSNMPVIIIFRTIILRMCNRVSSRYSLEESNASSFEMINLSFTKKYIDMSVCMNICIYECMYVFMYKAYMFIFNFLQHNIHMDVRCTNICVFVC